MKKFYASQNGRLALSLCLLLALHGCDPANKEKPYPFSLEQVIVLTPGKYITYRTDSLVFPQFGRQIATRSYLVKHVVDSAFTDNLGRTAYRILRFTNDTLATGPWQPGGSFSLTLTPDRLEWTEDNRRYVKLQQPLVTGSNWNGNRYLPDQPFEPFYSFSNDDNMQSWSYRCEETSGNFSFRSNTYQQVISIEQIDEQFNVPVVQTNAYAFRNRAVDRFSKGIGLIYRELECWEYQPNTGGSGGPYRVGFGIKQWMVDHN
jgi:hypothetical protein